MYVVAAGQYARKELVVGGLLSGRRLDALFEGPPETRRLKGAMVGKAGLHGAILSS
jgi:hypothetical protein